MNMTHTGELGYVFYIPNEFALHVYNSIIEAGKVTSSFKINMYHVTYNQFNDYSRNPYYD